MQGEDSHAIRIQRKRGPRIDQGIRGHDELGLEEDLRERC